MPLPHVLSASPTGSHHLHYRVPFHAFTPSAHAPSMPHPPFRVITAVWWETKDVTNRRHFIRTLVARSLADMLWTPAS